MAFWVLISRLSGWLGPTLPCIVVLAEYDRRVWTFPNSASLGTVVTGFDERGLPFRKEDEYASANYYSNILDAGKNGKIHAEMTASSEWSEHPQ